MSRIVSIYVPLAVLLSCGVILTVTEDLKDVDDAGLLVLTVATRQSDGFRAFAESANYNGITLKVLGLGKKWTGGAIEMGPGGGQKVNLLKEALEDYKDKKDQVVLFTDSFDAVFTGGPKKIMSDFNKFNADIIFSAENFCWPDAGLAEKYPQVKPTESRFLNSGGFMGYAPDIYRLINQQTIDDSEDDQLFYTQLFLDSLDKDDIKIKLDTKSEIFQCLNGALKNVQLKFKGSRSYLYNAITGTTPSVVHGNGPIKHIFNSLANYLNDRWTPTVGCRSCKEHTISFDDMKIDDYPTVTIGIFIEQPTPFIKEFLENIASQDYPKDKINLFIHNADAYHDSDVELFIKNNGSAYNKVTLHDSEDFLSDATAKNLAMEQCLQDRCEYYLMIDSVVQLENPRTLITLMEYNRSVIAPLLVRPEKLWSNFWGDLGKDGFYQRSSDYLDIIKSKQLGQWNVPFISSAILIHGNRLAEMVGGFIHEGLDPDMAFCLTARKQNIFLIVDNQNYYGHLVEAEGMTTTHKHNDLYQIFTNKYMWEKRYIHQMYRETLNLPFGDHAENGMEPCPDVYWFPIVTDTFCEHLIEEVENYGQWSGGKAEDPRLAGGYENVPTDDIHMNQIGWEPQWLEFLRSYVVPLANKMYIGYYSEGRSHMNFVVRYNKAVQDRLRPHQDSSTYTINIALNHVNLDFTGGGVRFERYNCSVTETQKGWMLMHPGRLTHQHEGLPLKTGTRYIMISFIDP